jgi:NADPH2:quinone reductase
MDDPARVIEEVGDLTHGRFCDAVIECTGKQLPLELSSELTRERGRLIIAGYHQDGIRQVNVQLWNWRGLDIINAHERDPHVYRTGMQQAVEAVESGLLTPDLLYTHSLPLSRLSDALDLAAELPAGFVKALVVP